MEHATPVRTFKARRRSSPGQTALLERLRGAYGVDPARAFDPVAAFGRSAPLVLEIGSGMGEATAQLAAEDPDRDVLAVEVLTPGVAALMRRLETAGLTNVRIAETDALPLLRERIAPGSLDEVRVFFPDPWPKPRHAKRRLVSHEFAELVADRLRPGGRLHVATDWRSYDVQALAVLTASPRFAVVSRDRGRRPVTGFEQKGLAAGRPPHDLVAERVA